MRPGPTRRRPLLLPLRLCLTLAHLLLHQQEEHVLHVVLDGAGLVGRDGARAERRGAGEEAQRAGDAAGRLVFLQDLHHLQRGADIKRVLLLAAG
uniref:Secreted protein n=1 Tax=Gasterosteus aculeatus TaxID=69293 RepID=G3Q427_GASAC